MRPHGVVHPASRPPAGERSRGAAVSLVFALLCVCGLTTGCATWPWWPLKGSSPSAPEVGPGMNAAGQVIDSSKVEAGRGKKILGIDGKVGEVTGRPAPGSLFVKLQIGMTVKQVIEALGAPSDQGVSTTYKAWLPWVSGGDQYRYEMVYKGQGRLIFDGPPGGSDWAGSRLVWIIHCPGERGYR